ncbi:ABC transporter substrate-binding protein [Labrys okinawensis]|uniref:ABC transporter substrate-binding protein n=1 Tax=Labrys okinawensis TaxID=346911 RepID=UPI0039BD038E
MRKLRVFESSLLAALALAGGLFPALARDFTVVASGGSFQALQKKVFFEPFARDENIKVVDDSWDNGIGILRTKAAMPDGGWDVVQVEAEEQQIGCDEGLFLPLDQSRIGKPEDVVAGSSSRCGVGSIIYNYVLGYDAAALKTPPRGWTSFFDLKQFPGKRALRDGPKGNLEIALMADGVAPGDVYKLLATDEGVERAFKKLDSIKPSLIFWKSGAQPIQLLSSGEVTMASSYNGRVTNAIRDDHKNFGIVWNQSLQTVDSWVIMMNSPFADTAYKFLAAFERPDRQKLLPLGQPVGITSVAALKVLDPKILSDLPTAPANSTDILHMDDKFWVDNIDALTARWAAWSGQ